MIGSFQDYLLSKVTVDDRALNSRVWENLRQQLQGRSGCLRVLEIGAGIGTMATRLLGNAMFNQVEYTGIDSNQDNIDFARQQLPIDLSTLGFKVTPDKTRSVIIAQKGSISAEIYLKKADLFDFIDAEVGQQRWDLIIAHAVLDLLEMPAALQKICRLGKPGSLHYYTINFDGVTIFEPGIEPGLDELILRLYHQTMDDRITNGIRSGDSRSGRHLFQWLQQMNHEILSAGSSDWVVFPNAGNYPGNEARFLEHILDFFETSLANHPDVPGEDLQHWLTRRRQQIKATQLVFIAHQMDFLARQTC